jgi:hypothetical protein
MIFELTKKSINTLEQHLYDTKEMAGAPMLLPTLAMEISSKHWNMLVGSCDRRLYTVEASTGYYKTEGNDT